MLRILLEEVLGYEDVVLVPDESSLSINSALQKLTGCENHRYIFSIHIIIEPIKKEQGRLL